MGDKFYGKRLLVLAGASVHIKVVEAAKNMGIYTVVTDNVLDSPAKKIADAAYNINIYDLPALYDLCENEKIDGAISLYIDPCQIPYNSLCEHMNFHCYGNREQFFYMTNKKAFKAMCRKYGVSTITEYTNIESVEYPVYVKPAYSRGSRGQSICFSKIELLEAIAKAKAEAHNEEVIIEKYMENASEFQVTYFFINGEAHLIRACDSYVGSKEHGMDKVVTCSVSPSIYTEEYLKNAHHNVINMFKALGIKNGPIFMQGFYDKGIFRFFDPGLRFPGVDYERIYKNIFGVDLIKAMISFALTGKMENLNIPSDSVWLKNKAGVILFPCIKAGKIAEIRGLDNISKKSGIISLLTRYNIGDLVPWTYTVAQRSAEIDFISDDEKGIRNTIDYIQEKLKFFDEYQNDMTFDKFDTDRIKRERTAQ